MPEGLMLVNVLPAFELNEVNITTPLLRMKKKSQKSRKKFATNKKIPTFAIPKEKTHKSSLKFIFGWIQGVLTMKEGVTSW